MFKFSGGGDAHKVSPGLLPLDEPGDDERALVSHQVVVVLDAAIGTRSAAGRRT